MAKVAKDCKNLMIKEISSSIGDKDTIIVTQYKGLSAQDLNTLRKELKKISASYLVVKDSIAKIALKDKPNSSVKDLMQEEVGMVLYKDDPTIVSKLLMQFAKEHELFKIKGGVTKGESVSKEDVSQLAKLPSREVMLTKLVTVLNSPIQGIASSLQGIIRKFVYSVNAVKEKRETNNTAGGSPQ